MEIWQNERLKIIKEILPSVGKNFVLKRGTALALYYGLDRYSEDIDLDKYDRKYGYNRKANKSGI